MRETTEFHTGILRFTLGVEESRTYWSATTPGQEISIDDAYESSWFGHKSQATVGLILVNMRRRYAAFPEALRVLHAWDDIDLPTARLICHWHTQMSDPLYRSFSTWVARQRLVGPGTLRRHDVLRWIEAEHPGRWATTTQVTCSSKLLAACFEAGLISSRRDPRPLTCPRVPDDALTYLLYLLRQVTFQGDMVNNPYLESVGLDAGLLADRVRHLNGVQLNRQGDLSELAFAAPDLKTWAGSPP